ncbi:coproporphyrinogen III oxidase [Clostridia bacterium]|nr:coproporphyrinogen III oxidase [Clostridia bacterium]
MDKLGLYVHIPFCARKCRYCDFVSYPVADKDTHLAYALKVILEASEKAQIFGEGCSVDTIYLGGGTPSLIEPGLISEILDSIYTHFWAEDDCEITIEVNPVSQAREKFRAYRSAGVNRVSIGVQSFDPDVLAFLGRPHTAEEAERAVADARAEGLDNINIDLMFGVPGQDLTSWERDLKKALKLAPEHISFYSLGIEEGTPLFEDLLEDRFVEIDEILDRRMYHLAKEILTDAGFRHYEISNAALPGRESRHNLKYWSMDPYLGLGAAAHSYFGGRRFANTSKLTEYMTAVSVSDMTNWAHENTPGDEMSEFVFLGLRRTEGIRFSDFHTSFGRDFWELYGEETEKLIRRGLLERDGDELRLTDLGLDLANNVFSEYV